MCFVYIISTNNIHYFPCQLKRILSSSYSDFHMLCRLFLLLQTPNCLLPVLTLMENASQNEQEIIQIKKQYWKKIRGKGKHAGKGRQASETVMTIKHTCRVDVGHILLRINCHLPACLFTFRLILPGKRRVEKEERNSTSLS